ncbi:AAA family ATPase [Arthrobacter sp. 7Tela_A1]|uniref:AAA family ATPase n=1 Tax=Arthrobacter sp. 7Tela_A1 TaxID=3093745 RepID=UPI003BB55317
MTENLPEPEQPEALPTRRGRRAAEARRAAYGGELPAAGDADGAPLELPAAEPGTAGEQESAAASPQPASGRRSRTQNTTGALAVAGVPAEPGFSPGSEAEWEPAEAYEPMAVPEPSFAPVTAQFAEPSHAAEPALPEAVSAPSDAGTEAIPAGYEDRGYADIAAEYEAAGRVERVAYAESTDSRAEAYGSSGYEGVQLSDEEPGGLDQPADQAEWGVEEAKPANGLAEGLPVRRWEDPNPRTTGISRIPLHTDLPASPFPATVPEPPAGPPTNSDEIPLMDDPAPAGEAYLPEDPAEMPTDLREKSRAAVRGEPQDIRRATFLDTSTAKIPATRGFRGFLASMGLRVAPSAKELSERRDVRMVSRHWPGPRTISVVNGKGGANKTPTTVMLAALFARNGGGPVLAWDNNETRGTLGWRTEQAQHDSTVMDLLPETALLLSPKAQSAMLAQFVHHQTDDKYDVLRSNPNVLASAQKVTQDDFDALHAVASKYFRLSIVDSGNDESAERWLRMIHHTDQLVIATTTVEEHAEAGALLLEALSERGGRYAELARGAVVIVSQADRNGTDAQARKVAEAFSVLARAAVTIPYDPALVKGQIRYASLRPATQRAWLRAAAAVAGGL